ACADHLRGQHRSVGACIAEIQQYGETVGFGGTTLELAIAQFEAIELGMQAIVLSACVAEINVISPPAANAGDRPVPGALERSENLEGPEANQADVVFTLDLKGE
ncbi:MAG: hypothetical protein WB787_15460, partial [Candidatus Acidiferrales bacterium]